MAWVLEKPGKWFLSRKAARSLGASHAWTQKLADADKFDSATRVQAIKDRYHLDDDSRPVYYD